MPTPTQALADHLLKQSVEQWVRERRRRGASYRRIALDLRDATKGVIEVTERTIAIWAIEPELPAEKAS